MKASWSTGSVQKLERLYKKYVGAMLRAAMGATNDRQLAEDAVQQTFEKVIGLIDRIDEEDEERTGGLLILMCRQAVFDLHNKKIRTIGTQRLDDTCQSSLLEERQEDLLEQFLRKESAQRLRAAIDSLDEKHAIPVMLKYGMDCSSTQIAEALGIEENLVNQRLYRARQKMKKYLTEQEEEPS